MLKKINALPREGRDTLFLLLVIALVLLSQVAHLPVWCSAVAASVLVWRAGLIWFARPLPAKGWLLLILGLTLAATAITHGTLLGRDAGVTLISVLLALKTLELRANRDAFVVFFLGFFTLLTHFFFSQSLLTALSMSVAMLGLLTALINSQMPLGRPALFAVAKIALKMACYGLPIMVLMFVLFPRLAPLWGMPDDAMGGRSGLSSSMKIGNITSLALDDSVAMRVQFEAAPPQSSELYFRGPVLSSFDGSEWQTLRSGFSPKMQLSANLKLSGTPFTYSITQEPNKRPWLLVLDGTGDKPDVSGFSVRMTSELQWITGSPINQQIRYRAKTHPRFSHGPLSLSVGLQDYIELPPGFNPRTLQLALDLRKQPRYAQADAMVMVQAVIERLQQGGYRYTLNPGDYGRHTADEFWFEKKQGFCEHIASAFVILMRALDIPARIVTGYQGGELNPMDGYWTVRNSDAHAWAEVWVENQGWIRVDPTAAVAPSRIGSQQRLQAPQGIFVSTVRAMSPGLALNLRDAWNAINNRWNQWILNYSQSQQFALLKRFGFTSPSWEDLSLLLASSFMLLGILASMLQFRARGRQDPWIQMLETVRLRVSTMGLDPPKHASPRQIAALLGNTPYDSNFDPSSLRRWLSEMEEWRYSARHHQSTHAVHELKRKFNQIKWPK